MTRTAQIVAGLAILWLGLVAVPAHGQRVQFPTPLGTDASGSAGRLHRGVENPCLVARIWRRQHRLSAVGLGLCPRSHGCRATGLKRPGVAGIPAGPSYAPAAPPGQAFGPAPATGPGPAAANGGILPPPNWDPYAPPGPAQPPALFQQEPAIPSPGVPLEPEITFEGMQRFLKELRVDYTWMAGNGDNQFGDNDIELAATFAIPLFNPQTPLLVTPGFAMNFLNGPVTPPAPLNTEMPGHVFDAYLDTAWHPQLRPGWAPTWRSASASIPTSPRLPPRASVTRATPWPCSL